MKKVILFGGGDAGGLIITENGVRPIPPFDPAIRKNLKAAAAMVNAISAAPHDTTRRKMATLANNLCSLAVQQVEDAVGPLDADHSLIFQDVDGGFTCGSTGKPPIPFPWPPRSIPSLPDLIAGGVIESDLVELVQQAHDHKIALIEVFEKPAEIAEQLGIPVSVKTINDLHLLAPSKSADIKDKTDREIIEFFQKVVIDGRYLETFLIRPHEVSEALKVKLSDDALERLATRGAPADFSKTLRINTDSYIVSFIVCIVVAEAIPIAIVAFAASSAKIEDHVIDRSGETKI